MRLAEKLGAFIDLFYIKPFSALVSPTVFRYAACGGVNMVLDLVWYFLIYHYLVAEQFLDLGFVVISPHILSLAIVFPITFFTGFWLNRHVAFRTTDVSSSKQLAKYLLTVLGAIAINYISMKLLVEHAHIWATPSKILTTVISTVYSYLVGRYYTFR